MSIILRALKKIQNQGIQQRFPVEDQEIEESSHHLALTSVAAPEKNFSPEPPPASDYSEYSPLDDAGQVGSGEKMKSGKLPRLLLGAIIALGILTTGWFARTIYFNSRDGEGLVNLEARANKRDTAQPEQEAPQEEAPALPIVISTPEVAAIPARAPAAVPQQAPAAQPVEAFPPAAVEPPRPAQTVTERAPQRTPEPPTEPLELATEALPPLAEASNKLPAHPKEAYVPQEEHLENQGRPEFKINAIAWRAQEPKAVINMQRVYVGDVIEGALVKEIRRKSVLMEYNGEEFELRF